MKTVPFASSVVFPVAFPFTQQTFVGCKVEVKRTEVLLADIIATAERLKEKGAHDQAFNSQGGGIFSLSAVGFARGPRVLGQFLPALAHWPKRMTEFLGDVDIIHCTQTSPSDERMLEELRIRV